MGCFACSQSKPARAHCGTGRRNGRFRPARNKRPFHQRYAMATSASCHANRGLPELGRNVSFAEEGQRQGPVIRHRRWPAALGHPARFHPRKHLGNQGDLPIAQTGLPKPPTVAPPHPPLTELATSTHQPLPQRRAGRLGAGAVLCRNSPADLRRASRHPLEQLAMRSTPRPRLVGRDRHS